MARRFRAYPREFAELDLPRKSGEFP